jgi:preprotein translocase subunit Sec63
MANYHYDEAGNMAAYFVISVLVIVLLPVTFSSIANVSSSEHVFLLFQISLNFVQNAQNLIAGANARLAYSVEPT